MEQNLSKTSSPRKNEEVYNRKEDLEISLGFTMACVGFPEKEMEKAIPVMIESIAECFPDIKFKYILQALKKGSLGFYGQTYKLTAQEVCIWIRKYYDEETDEGKRAKKQKDALTFR